MSDQILQMKYPQELEEIAGEVHGDNKRPAVPLREVLSWFGHSRRSRRVLREIYAAFDELNLGTKPAVNRVHPDAHLVFVPIEDAERFEPRDSGELTYRVGRLSLAANKPVSVKPTDTVQRAIALMMENNFSQLPAIENDSTVFGLFSWRTLARQRHFGREAVYVQDALEPVAEVRPDTSLFKILLLLEEHECILLRDDAGKIASIITAHDTSKTFHQLTNAFLEIGDIERHIRALIENRFTVEDIRAAVGTKKGSRQIQSVDDLTNGDYIRLLDHEQRWQQFSIPIDRTTFIESFEMVRQIRNDVMHFDPDGIDDNDREKLRKFLRLLQQLLAMVE